MTHSFNGDPVSTDLIDVQEWIMEHRSDGCICPACHQHVKLYRRKLHSSMALALIYIYRYYKRNGPAWVKIENLFKAIPNLPATVRGDAAKLRFWGLIEPKKGSRDDGSKRNGYYRITAFGIDFIGGRVKVHSHLYQFVGKSWLDGEAVSIEDVLGNKFDYAELMRGS